MHECTSIIINSFHLFQQAKGFKVTHIGKGGRPPSNNFLQLPPIKTDASPWVTRPPPPNLKMNPPPSPPSEKQSPPTET